MPTNARTERCDVAELADCRQLMLSPQRQLGGIYHAAGVLSDALIAKQTEVMLRRVFAPKAHAATLLQEASLPYRLDSCVLFSSIAALYYSVAQANYAAANGSLDALANHRVKSGQAAVSVQWGPWAGVGMASGDAINARMKKAGIGLITEHQGLSALEIALLPTTPRVMAVTPVVWNTLLRSGAVPTLLSSFAPQFSTALASGVAAAATAARSEYYQNYWVEPRLTLMIFTFCREAICAACHKRHILRLQASRSKTKT